MAYKRRVEESRLKLLAIQEEGPVAGLRGKLHWQWELGKAKATLSYWEKAQFEHEIFTDR
jgi:hypothetical protein